jgi:hypothetical protein
LCRKSEVTPSSAVSTKRRVGNSTVRSNMQSGWGEDVNICCCGCCNKGSFIDTSRRKVNITKKREKLRNHHRQICNKNSMHKCWL